MTSVADQPTPELVIVEPRTTVVVRGTISTDEVTVFFDRSFGVLGEALRAQGLTPGGPAFALYRGVPDETMDLEVGFPVARRVEPDGAVEPGELPGGRVARLVHAGSFDGLTDAWQRLGTWIGQQGLTPGSPFWELYLIEPRADLDPVDLRTELNWPVA